MLEFNNFGKKSLDEIKSILEAMGLHLGMSVPSSAFEPAAVKVPADENNEEE